MEEQCAPGLTQKEQCQAAVARALDELREMFGKNDLAGMIVLASTRENNLRIFTCGERSLSMELRAMAVLLNGTADSIDALLRTAGSIMISPENDQVTFTEKGN